MPEAGLVWLVLQFLSLTIRVAMVAFIGQLDNSVSLRLLKLVATPLKGLSSAFLTKADRSDRPSQHCRRPRCHPFAVRLGRYLLHACSDNHDANQWPSVRYRGPYATGVHGGAVYGGLFCCFWVFE